MKEFNKKLTEDMYQKWNNGTTIEQLEKETNLRKDAIYKRFGRLRKERTQNDIRCDTQNADTLATETDTGNAADGTIRDCIDANMIVDNENIYNREEDILTQSECENENQEAVSSTQNMHTKKTGFVTGRTVTYVTFAILLSILVILYWPQISNALKTIASKIRNNVNQDDVDAVS